MKQRLLLALLMVFASVGLIGAQGASPSSNAVPINITIPAGSDKVTIQVKSDNGLKAAPNLFKSSDEKIPASGGENTLPYTYTIDQTSSEQTVFFENASGGSTDDWKGLEMVITGPVSSFVVSGDNGAIAKSLTSLSFVNNDGVLETLKLASVEGGIAYVPELTSLTIPAAKLKVLPYKGNKITTYSVGEQTPEMSSPISLSRNTDNSVSITSTQLGLTQEVSIESIAAEGIAATKNASGNWELKKNGVWASGTMTLKLTLSGKYEGAVINVPVSLTDVSFKLSVSKHENCDLAFQKGTASFNYETETLVAGDEITVTITPNDNNVLSSLQTEGLDWVTDRLPEEDELTYIFRVKGDVAPSISVTCVAQEEEKATVSLFTNVANDGLVHANVTTGSGSDLVSTADVGTSLTVSAKAPDGYVLDVIKVQGTEQSGLTEKDGVYTCTFTVEEGTNSVEVYFKQGAKVTTEVSGEVSGTNDEILIMAETDPVEESTTLAPETEVTITPPTAATGWKLVSVTINGEPCSNEGQSAGTYTATLSAGTNHIVATYENQAAEIKAYYFGIAAENVSITPASGLKAGDEITVETAGTLPNGVTGIEKVVINGQEDAETPFEGKAVAGDNVVIVYGKTTPTLTISGTGNVDKYVTVEDAEGNTLKNGSAVTDGSNLTITIQKVDGYTVEAYFNNTKLAIGTENTVKAAAPYSLIVNYTKEAEATVGTVTVIPQGAGSASMRKMDNNPYWAIDVTPSQGYGVLGVVANGNAAGQFFATNTYIFLYQPGANNATVYLTNKSTVTTAVEAGEDTGAPSATNVTVTTEDGKTVEANQTLEPGTQIKISATTTTGYEVKSISVNGKALTTSTTGEDTWGETTLAVGNNHVVVLYDDMKGKEFKVIAVGDDNFSSSNVTYYKEGSTTAATTSELVAGDRIEVKLNTTKTVYSVYFNNTKLSESDGVYKTGTVQAGDNYLYVFFDAQAIVKTLTVGEGVASVEVKNGTATVGEDAFLDPGTEITMVIR